MFTFDSEHPIDIFERLSWRLAREFTDVCGVSGESSGWTRPRGPQHNQKQLQCRTNYIKTQKYPDTAPRSHFIHGGPPEEAIEACPSAARHR